jgi:hypothetical protein
MQAVCYHHRASCLKTALPEVWVNVLARVSFRELNLACVVAVVGVGAVRNCINRVKPEKSPFAPPTPHQSAYSRRGGGLHTSQMLT